MFTNKTQLAIKQLLARAEPGIYEQVNVIIDNAGSLKDVEDYCKLLEHAVKTVRNHLAQDARIAAIGDDPTCANFACENKDYNACVADLLLCLKLTANPMYRDDLRLRYYEDILNPKNDVDYRVMSVSLENMVTKLNGGKPYTTQPQTEQEPSVWQRWFPTFSAN